MVQNLSRTQQCLHFFIGHFFLTLFFLLIRRSPWNGNGAISDPQLSASSQWNNNYAPNLARLNIKEKLPKHGAWSSRTNNGNQWLQVDLNDITTVTRLATQGRNVRGSSPSQWVTRYKLRFSIDGCHFPRLQTIRKQFSKGK